MALGEEGGGPNVRIGLDSFARNATKPQSKYRLGRGQSGRAPDVSQLLLDLRKILSLFRCQAEHDAIVL